MTGSVLAPGVSDSYGTRLTEALAPLRGKLTQHRMYARLDSLPALRVFMEAHVFAVWDFMSLLKTLQQRITCVTVPWHPPADPCSARIINEIVLVEESDVAPDDRDGQRHGSHFQFYLEAMREIGASTRAVDVFLRALRDGHPPAHALRLAEVHPGTRAFVLNTLDTVTRETHEVAASFLLGREALIPAMFEQLLQVTQPARGSMLAWYFERHLAVDAEEHGPAAFRLLARLCGDSAARWAGAAMTARRALRARSKLWDGVADTL